MKTILLGRGTKKTKVMLMSHKEFEKFLEGKTVYYYSVNWIEKWGDVSPITEYFPYQGFVMSSEHTLGRYDPRYDTKCLSAYTTEGTPVWKIPRWKVSIRENKNGNLYYVTKMDTK